jgi:nitrous oxide reductase accessory protein NosL
MGRHSAIAIAFITLAVAACNRDTTTPSPVSNITIGHPTPLRG